MSAAARTSCSARCRRSHRKWHTNSTVNFKLHSFSLSVKKYVFFTFFLRLHAEYFIWLHRRESYSRRSLCSCCGWWRRPARHIPASMVIFLCVRMRFFLWLIPFSLTAYFFPYIICPYSSAVTGVCVLNNLHFWFSLLPTLLTHQTSESHLYQPFNTLFLRRKMRKGYVYLFYRHPFGGLRSWLRFRDISCYLTHSRVVQLIHVIGFG